MGTTRNDYVCRVCGKWTWYIIEYDGVRRCENCHVRYIEIYRKYRALENPKRRGVRK